MKLKRYSILALAVLAVLMAGCGKSSAGQYVFGQRYYNPAKETEATEQVDGTESGSSDDVTIGSNLFMVTNNDMQSECLILEQIASGKQYMYNYTVTTRFLDKYGNRTTVSDFEPGRVIEIDKKDMQGRLLQASISDEVWEYPDITRYSIDEERGVFRIADTNYSYGENLFVNSDGAEEKLSDLTSLDTLRVVGIGKQILSVSVTTGHGVLQLSNTELFEGSFIQIGSKIFSEITENMDMELPEGTYMVAVANNGYGGSTDIEINRGKTTVLDLDTLKGEGPKYGSILFAVDVEDAIVVIDGKAVDYSEPVSLQYGVHSLEVSASAYETYSKKLFVNSEQATIVIGLSGEGTSTDTTADAGTDTGETADETTAANDSEQSEAGKEGSLAGSLAGSHSEGGTSSGSTSGSTSTGNAVDEAELNAMVDSLLNNSDSSSSSSSDYVSTLTTLLKSLTGTSD